METDSNDSSSRGISFLSSSQSTASINSSVLQSSECASELFERSSEEQADHHVSSCQEMSDGDDNGEQLDADDADPASEEVFNKPLYHGSNITLLESYMMIMKYSLRHSLTKQALGDLLALDLSMHISLLRVWCRCTNSRIFSSSCTTTYLLPHTTAVLDVNQQLKMPAVNTAMDVAKKLLNFWLYQLNHN